MANFTSSDEIYFYFYQDILSSAKTNQEVNFLLSELRLTQDSEYLDIPCGYGRHAVEIASRLPNIKVSGADISSFFLRIANTSKEKLALNNLTFLQEDMRSLNPHKQFDALTCLYTSFGYFDDATNLEILKQFNQALKPGGKLIIDYINKTMLHEGNNIFARKNEDFIMDKIKKGENGVFHFERTYMIAKEQYKFDYIYRSYDLIELTQLLYKVGFKIADTFGDFDGQKYTTISPRLIVSAIKT